MNVQNAKEVKVADLYAQMKVDLDLNNPALLNTDGEIIYIPSPETLEVQHRAKLEKTVQQLIDEKIVATNDAGTNLFVMVTDKNVKSKLYVKIDL